MSEIVYRITTLLCQILVGVPVGTNQGLLHLLFALVSGRFLQSRGAVFAALADLGLCPAAVRRAEAAFAYGSWQIADLIAAWRTALRQEGQSQPRSYGGFRPVPCDLVGFFRPRLCGHTGKHYTSQAAKALPAVVVGLAVSVVQIGRNLTPSSAERSMPIFAPIPTRRMNRCSKPIKAGAPTSFLRQAERYRSCASSDRPPASPQCA